MIHLISEEDVVSMSIWVEIIKSYRYEMKPTKKQEVKSIRTLEILRHLYNWSLGERKDGWKNGGWSVRYKDQQDHLKILRKGLDKENEELGKELNEVYEQVEQNQVKRVDLAYEKYFERVKNNKNNPKEYKKPGYPRFKGINRMKSFTFNQYGNGCHIVDKHGNKDENGDFIRLSKIGDIKFIKHVEIGEIEDSHGNKVVIPYQIKTVTIKKEVDKWIFIPVISTFIEIKIPIDAYKKLGIKSDILIIEDNKKKAEKISKELRDLFLQISKINGEKQETTKAVKEINTVVENKEINTVVENKEINTIEELQKELNSLNNKCVGNDMGLPNLITDSNGKRTEAPKYLYKSAKRLRKEQQKLSRKQKYDELDDKGNVKIDPKTNKKLWKGSKNRDKQVIKVAKVHRRVKNQRRNFDHIESKEKVKNHDVNIFEKLPITKMIKNRKYAKAISDSGWGQLQRFTVYKAEWAGKTVDFVDPAYTSQICSDHGHLVGKMEDKTANGMFICPVCNLSINVHASAGINIRNRSPIYQQKLDDIYRRLSPDMKILINTSEKKLRDNIYCWSLDPEDCWNDDKRISRDAAARIYAFGDVAATHMEPYEQVTSWKKEALSKKGDVSIENMSIQAPPFRAG